MEGYPCSTSIVNYVLSQRENKVVDSRRYSAFVKVAFSPTSGNGDANL